VSIKNWPVHRRPREKLLAQGAETLTDSELLAAIFGTGNGRKSALEMSEDLLKRYVSLRSLMASSLDDFRSVPGLGVARYVLLQAAVEFGRRVSVAALERGDKIDTPDKAEDFLQSKINHHEHEVFAVLFLDNKHRLLAFERLFYGTIDSTTVHTRQVLKRCLHHNAAAVILAHNHPSGVAEPSDADIQITNLLRDALKMVDVRLLDHVVVGGKETCSLAEMGHC